MIKKLFLSIALVASVTACTDDYKDWADPMHNDQPETFSFGNGSVSGTSVIEFANVTTDSVQVCNITAPTVSDETYTPFYKITIGDTEFDLSADGYMNANELKSYIENTYGKAPTERDMEAVVTMWVYNGSTAVKVGTSNTFNVKAILDAPDISENYYIVGGTLDWATSASTKEQKFSHSDQSVYDDPVFTITIPASSSGDTWFAIGDDEACDAITNDNDWSKLLGTTSGNGNNGTSGSLAPRSELADDGSFCVPGGCKYIRITINMLEYTYTIEELNFNAYIYEAGVNNGWGDSYEAPLYGANYDGEYIGFIYCQTADWVSPSGYGAFKFRGSASDWDHGNWGTGTMGSDYMSGTLVDDNAGNIVAPEGFYKATINLSSMTYALTPITYIDMIGDATPGGWDSGTAMTYNATEHCWEVETTLTSGTFKFRGNGSWDNADGNWGGSMNDIINGSNDNISDNTTTGNVLVRFYPSCDTKSYCTVEKR